MTFLKDLGNDSHIRINNFSHKIQEVFFIPLCWKLFPCLMGISSWLGFTESIFQGYKPSRIYTCVSWFVITQLSSCRYFFFRVVQLTKIFSAFDEGLDSPPLVEDAVTVVATLNGLIVWCTFKNFLSVTFMMLVCL